MAIAKKCDRCGRFYEAYSVWDGNSSRTAKAGKPNGITFARLNAESSEYCAAEYKGIPRSKFMVRDLCSDCMDELLEWWAEGGTENE